MQNHPLYTYRGYYLILGIPGILLALLAPLLQTAYVVVFFLINLNVLFEWEQDEYDVEHSSTTHYLVHLRHNQLNYAIAAIVVIEGALIATNILSPAFLTFLSWTANAFLFSGLLLRAEINMTMQLISDYIFNQDLTLTKKQAQLMTLDLIAQPELSAADLAQKYDVTVETCDQVIHFYQTYVTNNGLV